MSGMALREPSSQVRIQSYGEEKLPALQPELEVALLTGGQDRHYAFGLAMALIAKGVSLDVIGSDLEDGPEMHSTPRLRFLKLHRSTQKANVGIKIIRILASYAGLIRYAATAEAS